MDEHVSWGHRRREVGLESVGVGDGDDANGGHGAQCIAARSCTPQLCCPAHRERVLPFDGRLPKGQTRPVKEPSVTGSSTGETRRSPCPPPPSFRSIFDEHFEYVLRSLMRLGAPEADLDDLAQEVFVVLHRRLPELDLSRPLKPYLFGVALNVVRAHRGKARRAPTQSLGEQERGGSDPNLRALLAADLVHRALATLDDDVRAVVILRDLDGCSMAEVTATLEIPRDTAYGRLRRGREQLTLALKRLGGVP